MRYIPYVTFSLSLLLVNNAYAAEMEIGMQAYFRVVWGLAVVIALMLGVYYFVRKRFSPLHTRNDKTINILEIQPIMPKKSLCLIEVCGKKILLGITQDSITTITEFAQETDSTNSFADHLAQSTQQRETGSTIEP